MCSHPRRILLPFAETVDLLEEKLPLKVSDINFFYFYASKIENIYHLSKLHRLQILIHLKSILSLQFYTGLLKKEINIYRLHYLKIVLSSINTALNAK